MYLLAQLVHIILGTDDTGHAHVLLDIRCSFKMVLCSIVDSEMMHFRLLSTLPLMFVEIYSDITENASILLLKRTLCHYSAYRLTHLSWTRKV